ncbi:MAG: hypothetical protein QOJ68_2970 [Blastococcus sp.]|jgi:hypothetical protein|nr:hypothetical protein [Blastococcus sp.]
MDLDDGVAVRIASLCLDAKGRLLKWLICATAVRAALLVDLALAGRLESTEDSISIDPTPTGFAPADRLLAAVGVEHERSLDGWLDERRIGLRDVAEANVRSGRWSTRHALLPTSRRYSDRQPDATNRDRQLRYGPGAEQCTPADAAVAVIGLSAGLLVPLAQGPAAEILLARAGAARWLCEAVGEHLVTAKARNSWSAAVLGAGGI